MTTKEKQAGVQMKFRMWDKNEKVMIYADEAKNSKNLLAIGLHGLPIAVDRDSFRKDDEIIGWNVDHYLIPMQFTGLHDKNGKEAYQDDLVNLFDRSIYHIERDENYARFQLRWISGQCELINIYDMSLIQYGEIVGNVYENANLLPEEQS
jgi:hypothetical protein